MQKFGLAGRGPPWSGEIEGTSLGGSVSVILTSLGRSEKGPDLHRHPYDETFFVRAGSASFSDGTTTIVEANAGDVVVIQAGTPHRFDGLKDGVEMIDIHASDRFFTEWL